MLSVWMEVWMLGGKRLIVVVFSFELFYFWIMSIYLDHCLWEENDSWLLRIFLTFWTVYLVSLSIKVGINFLRLFSIIPASYSFFFCSIFFFLCYLSCAIFISSRSLICISSLRSSSSSFLLTSSYNKLKYFSTSPCTSLPSTSLTASSMHFRYILAKF